jgi:hypothetical protein
MCENLGICGSNLVWVIALIGVFLIGFGSWLLWRNRKSSDSSIADTLQFIPPEGSIYDFPGTCPAKFVVDRVFQNPLKVVGTLLIQLPPGARMVGPMVDDDDNNSVIMFNDTNGGGGSYTWDWGECTWPKELKHIKDIYAPNIKILPG